MCAPLARFHNVYAYTEGVCYELNSELRLDRYRVTCMQKNLIKEDRHNDYGACLEGFSLYLRNVSLMNGEEGTQETLLTGLPGARKWTGGVFAFVKSDDEFGNFIEKYTMGVKKEDHGVHSLLTSHDYLGYSVALGRFGFW